MPTRAVKKHSPVGSSPGVLHVPENALPTRLRLVTYDDGGCQESDSATLDDVRRARQASARLWVDLRGLGDLAVLEGIAREFDIHPLALEDVLNVPQRPKQVLYGGNQQIVLQMLVPHHIKQFEQLSLFVGDGWVVTYQERYEDDFDGVRQRLRSVGGRLSSSNSGYLAYALIDAVVDAYFPHLDTLHRSLETLEEEVFEQIGGAALERIHVLRGVLLELRRAAWPQREVVQSLLRGESRFFDEHTQPYLRDTYDHAIEILDQIDSGRDAVTNLTQIHLSMLSQRTNDVMRWLTVMASLFIPLTFIAGVYGMNFEHMPELEWRWSYPVLWLVMLIVSVALLTFFARKGWLSDDD